MQSFASHCPNQLSPSPRGLVKLSPNLFRVGDGTNSRVVPRFAILADMQIDAVCLPSHIFPCALAIPCNAPGDLHLLEMPFEVVHGYCRCDEIG